MKPGDVASIGSLSSLTLNKRGNLNPMPLSCLVSLTAQV